MANIIDTKEKTVIVTHRTRCKDTAKALKGEENPCKEYSTTFDFSACSDAEILTLASKTCTIAFRTKSKVNDITEEAFAALMVEPIDVHEQLKAEKRGLSNEQKLDRITGGMNKDEINNLIKKLSNR